MSAKAWRFEPLDTWFFREARPFGAATGGELSSVFPPPAHTVAGAVRTLIGAAQGVDWERFARDGEYADLKRQIGVGDDPGQLHIGGPYPLWKGERLYPAPLHLLAKTGQYTVLKPGEPVECDLGKVRLPQLATALSGAKPLDHTWLDSPNLHRVLQGQFPETIYRASDLYAEESRLGIARDPARRTAAEGLLYHTRHLRPRPELAIGVTVSGIPAELHPARDVTRFGGEGRASAVTVDDACPLPPAPKIVGSNLLLVLLTHADFGGGWQPPGFAPVTQDDVRVWRGLLNGVELTLHSPVLGKAVREGGWDLLRQEPRPVKSLIPAGSVYFCSVEGDVRAAVTALHGRHAGHATALGRGELAVGFW
jgi:CRISPR-associated protein Cmr3